MLFTPKLIILPILAAVVTFILVPVIRQVSVRCGAVTLPGGRHRHKGVIPLSGGLAIFFGFLSAALFLNNASPEILGFLIGATVIASVGFIDDKFKLPPIAKFLGQTAAALIVITAGVRIGFIGNLGSGNDGVYHLGFLSLPLTFIWIIGITNAINFIDGLDGLASGVSSIAAFTLGTVALMSGRTDVAVICFTLGAASIAFLPYNFTNHPKYKIFMGDSGSGFLGYSLGVLSIMGVTKVAAVFSMLVPIIILAIPIFDTGYAIIRRLISGKSPFEADRKHLHHRIMDKGYSNKQTAVVIYIVTLVLSLVAIMSMSVEAKYIPYLVVGALIVFAVFLWKVGIIKSIRRRRDCELD